jgi:hypothetical protein
VVAPGIPSQIPLQAWSSRYDVDLCDLVRFLLYCSLWCVGVHSCYDFFAIDGGASQEVRCAGQPGCPGELGLRSLAATRSGLIFIPGGAAQRHVDSPEKGKQCK